MVSSFSFTLLIGLLVAFASAGVFGVLGALGPGRGPRIARMASIVVTMGGSVAGCALAINLLLAGQTLDFQLPVATPLGQLALRLDPLSSFFLLIICGPTLLTAVYSEGYIRHIASASRSGLLLAFLNVFVLAMTVVVLAGDAVTFLIAWELMSLATFFLILFDHEDPASRKAAILYVVMTHVGTAFLLVMFLTLAAGAGSLSLEAMRQSSPLLSATMRTIVFLSGFVGFGIKAGVIPLHIWLPEAHPAAPSNVSALMSGVMIKMGIYGMARVFLGILGPGPQWWGMMVLIVAVLSAVLGVLYALMEHDIKRLLAFHSIENIGIILIGLGAAMLFRSLGSSELAALALCASLFHTLNHALFKGLLFMGAGSIVQATGTKNIEELGGLAKRLPWTSLFFLTGAIAISALPPLNGFMSEWLTYQALLLGFSINSLAVKIAVPLSVALLALTSALAAACFVKAFGITFLGTPRSIHASSAHEAPASMLAAMGVSAVACVLVGILPGSVLTLLNPVAGSILGNNLPWGTIAAPWALAVLGPGTTTGAAPLAVALLLAALVLVPAGVGLLLGRGAGKREAMTWACGLKALEPQMQYSATGFSKPLLMIFSSISRARHEIEITGQPSSYFHPSIRFGLRTEHLVDRYLYVPSNNAVLAAARVMRRIQTGRIQTYLAYLFFTLILLLVFAR